MAGTLQVNDRLIWNPAGWIFNNVLERIALRLESDDADLANQVFDSLGPVPGHLDLSATPPDRLQLFTRAAEVVIVRAEEVGNKAFAEVGFYEPFMSELRQLIQLLHSDPRTQRE